ncbi:hypothetical protein DYB28_013553 [Aphanomyces astaci]|uniref:t-SNARE coiled-coil homology domain-containing protein n=1 Tax=Aphanomyces astaci TaxID=112090 RepID=A0A397BLB5_APHAT|nr:hypothetical protein DYB36_004187 [Aphanomyces astaci]RHY20740.1 hypothetical protein DYB25_001537 [Aphanomyces astaci]RHY38255.1 hypothetical protein DYB34_002948 [Aphanomyces astaci]RHY60920.1 hypothetical protein DYB30_002348 [Aphanomyces astaci]RHZ04809.1 hypothetical protein DYB31_007440 [Aphanomyces astaci]
MSRELDGLLDILAKINVEMGGEETREKKGMKKGDRFGELRVKISERLHALKINLNDISQPVSTKKPMHPREKIQQQQAIRNDLQGLEEDLEELRSVYDAEAKKKKSKLTKEELQIRKDFVDQYTSELEFVKEQASNAYLKASPAGRSPQGGAAHGFDRTALFGTSTAVSPSAGQSTFAAGFNGNGKTNGWTGGSGGGSGGGGGDVHQEETTTEHRDVMLQIEQKDQHLDGLVDQIGTGVMELGQLARGLNEELVKQNIMLEGLEERIDNTSNNVENLNAKMKKTLTEMGRSGDKCMMDFICLVILLGILAVVYNMFVKKTPATK